MNAEFPQQDFVIHGTVTEPDVLQDLLSESYSQSGGPAPRFLWQFTDEHADVVATVDDCEGEWVFDGAEWQDEGAWFAPLFAPEGYNFVWPATCDEDEPCEFKRCIGLTLESESDVEVLWSVEATLWGGYQAGTRPTAGPVEIEFFNELLDGE